GGGGGAGRRGPRGGAGRAAGREGRNEHEGGQDGGDGRTGGAHARRTFGRGPGTRHCNGGACGREPPITGRPQPAHMLSMSLMTRESSEAKGSLQSTVRWAW